MFIKDYDISGLRLAIKGMRNPLNSWEKSDSFYNEKGKYEIGNNDKDLMKRLIKAGGEHRKFLRMVHIQLDIEIPRYMWSEFDTYKFNVKNSCSTMHKLLSRDNEIKKEMFYIDDEDKDILDIVIKRLNEIRDKYLESKDYRLKERAKRILPESFKQLRTVDSNMEEIMNIIKQRKNHQLKCWRDFINELLEIREIREIYNLFNEL